MLAAVTPPDTVRVPAKINLHLAVGALRSDGYHDLATVFHAVSLFDEVTVAATDHPGVEVHGEGAGEVPTDGANLAWRAVELVAAHAGRRPDVRVVLRKGIPVTTPGRGWVRAGALGSPGWRPAGFPPGK